MPIRTCWTFLAAALLLVVLTTSLTADNWPQFRGQSFDGISRSAIPTSWSDQKNIRWKVPIAGEGWSAPVVWENNVFLTAAERTDGGVAKPDEYRGGGGQRRSDLLQADYRWDVICLDAKTGKEKWRRTARNGHPTLPRHSTNTYATETPVTDGKHVYAYFGMMGLYCYDMQGELQWTRDLGSFEMRAGWGTSSSPVLFEDKLFLQIDNEEQSFIVALDAGTGDEIWKVNRNEATSYSSPIVWKNSERSELIAGGMVYRSYDPETGKLLWKLDMEKGRSSATPLAVGDRLFVGTEFRNRGGSDDGGGFLFCIKPGGSGDISPEAGATSGRFVEWKIPNSGIQMASPVLCEGYVYLLERRRGALHVIDADTGETAYRQRFPGARAFWSSPWTNEGKVYCLSASGTTFVVEGGPDFEIVSENDIDEQTWSTPALADGAIYLRTVDHLYCISEAGK